MVSHGTVRARLGQLPMPELGVKCGPGPQAWSVVYPFAGPQSAFYPRPVRHRSLSNCIAIKRVGIRQYMAKARAY